ncbi:unnamed protein product [Protopolystoma xenopodis]|uniref:Uncharacterized protein n=1 Tax=Protopolystoma xenopodis TaxID=117903 RepID=A0A448X362_9PLAT|nr:unnamed protein product [Protopolystoma xenopodis]
MVIPAATSPLLNVSSSHCSSYSNIPCNSSIFALRCRDNRQLFHLLRMTVLLAGRQLSASARAFCIFRSLQPDVPLDLQGSNPAFGVLSTLFGDYNYKNKFTLLTLVQLQM